jgi:hypothetical protein
MSKMYLWVLTLVTLFEPTLVGQLSHSFLMKYMCIALWASDTPLQMARFQIFFRRQRLDSNPRTLNRTAHIRHQCRKTTVLSCHRCLISSGVEKMNNIQIQIITLTTKGLYYKTFYRRNLRIFAIS